MITESYVLLCRLPHFSVHSKLEFLLDFCFVLVNICTIVSIYVVGTGAPPDYGDL